MIAAILLATLGQGWAWADKPPVALAQMCPMPHQGAAKPADSPILGKCGLALCNCCEAVKGMDAARKDDFDLIRHQAEQIKAAEKAEKAKALPAVEPAPYRVWVTNQGRYGWGRIVDGSFVPVYGDNPSLYDSGPPPKMTPPAWTPQPSSIRTSPSCYTDSRGRRVCPR